MSLEFVNTVSQFLAALGVVAGLFFVGLQIRHNTRAVRASTFHGITDSFNAVNLTIGGDTATARVLRLGFAGLSNLTEDERTQMSFIALSAFRVMETLYYESRIGIGERDLWITEEKTIRALTSNPGMREWWVANPLSFTPEFRKIVDDIIATTPLMTAPQPAAEPVGFRT